MTRRAHHQDEGRTDAFSAQTDHAVVPEVGSTESISTPSAMRFMPIGGVFEESAASS